MEIPSFVSESRFSTPASMKQLFFNSAGSSLISTATKKVMLDYLDQEIEIGGYDVMMECEDETNEFYKEAAKLINAEPHNIAYQTSATDAYSKVLYSMPWKENDLILTTSEDYVSNVLSFIELKRRFGVNYEFLETDDHGLVDLDKLDKILNTSKVKLLAIAHMPTSSGMIQDAVYIGQLAKKHKVLYLLDACQTVGQMNVDVSEIHCDYLTVTGRKFLRGPRGTGFLFVNDEILEKQEVPFCFDLAGAEWIDNDQVKFAKNARRYELWEKNYSNLLGLTQSIREINEIGIEEVEQYNRQLQKHFRSKLTGIPNLELFDQGWQQGNIISWRIKGKSQKWHSEKLRELKVNFSFASKHSALIDMKNKGIDWAVRFSPHYFNLPEECDQFVAGFSNNYA